MAGAGTKGDVLVVGRREADSRRIREAMGAACDVGWARGVAQALARLATRTHLAVLVDRSLPPAQRTRLEGWIGAQGRKVPVIVMPGGENGGIADAFVQHVSACVARCQGELHCLPMLMEQEAERHELLKQNRLLSEIIEHASDCIIVTDAAGLIHSANRTAEVTFGYEADEMRGHSIALVFPRTVQGSGTDLIIDETARQGAWRGSLTAKRQDGKSLPVSMTTSALHDAAGNVSQLLFVARDVSERRELFEKLRRLSVTDELTGLFNYRFFRERLRYEFRRARRYRYALSLVMLDLDYFKGVNDAHGHQAGDKVLREVAQVIAASTRNVDIVARYGGEEFTVLLPNTGEKGAWRCAEMMWEAVGRTVVAVDGAPVRLTASVGVSTLATDTENEDELLRQADTALLMAKQRGRNNFCAWNEIRLEMEQRVKEEAGSVADLRARLQQLSQNVKGASMEQARPLLTSAAAHLPHVTARISHVSALATQLAIRAHLPEAEVEAVRYAALLHDMGNIGIRADILHQARELTAEEMAAVREHPIISEAIAGELTFLENELPVIRHHHEHFDGAGYPDGLAGQAIPVGARVLAIADAFDAMTSDRPYRAPMTREAALAELRACSGTQFDPDLLKVFEAMHCGAVVPAAAAPG